MKCLYLEPVNGLPLFTEVPRGRVLRSTHGPRPVLILPTNALWALLEQALRREATGAAGSSSTFREQLLTRGQMPCPQAEALKVGAWKKRSLTTRRRALDATTPQQDDPGRCEAQLDPLDALPAFVPAGVVADLGVEPDAGTLRLEHPFVGGVVLRVVQRRGACAAVDGVARAERLHRRRARPEGACDPLVAAVLLNPTADVGYEIPERYPLIYSHTPSPLFNCNRISVLAYIRRAQFSSIPEPTAGCIDTGLPVGRRYFGQSDKPFVETAIVHHARWVMFIETRCHRRSVLPKSRSMRPGVMMIRCSRRGRA